MIFNNSKELFQRVLFEIRSDMPYEVYIFTYGLWAGVNDNGVCFNKNNIYQLLYFLNIMHEEIKTTVVVGYDNNISERILQTAKRFNKLKFVVSMDTHIKCILTSTGILSIGSSNLTDSEWHELNVCERVDVESEKYIGILRYLKMVVFYGDEITDSYYSDVSIEDIISNVVNK